MAFLAAGLGVQLKACAGELLAAKQAEADAYLDEPRGQE